MRSYRGAGYRLLYDVVRESPGDPETVVHIREAKDVVSSFVGLQALGHVPRERECFAALLLNAIHSTIGFHIVSIGSLNSALVHPREVFRMAVTIGAHSIVLAHNHPSGDSTPSDQDRRITERLTEAGELLGIQVIDHVVIGDTSYFSFADSRHYPIESKCN